jgi:hypothetical protein
MYNEDNKLIPPERQFLQFDGDMDFREAESPNVWPEGVEPISSDNVKERLIPNAGARPADRSEHYLRVINTIENGEGEIIESEDEVGGFPNLEENERSLSPPQPGNGLQEWLNEHTRAVEES